jgi:trimeric autotransporter adhesin
MRTVTCDYTMQARRKTRERNQPGVLVTGELQATGDVVAFGSDARLKTNIEAIPSALDKVCSLRGVTFDWKAEALDMGLQPRNRVRDAGILAQDVQAVLPQAVHLAPFDSVDNPEDPSNPTSKSGENYLTVQYEKLVPLLVESIKELGAKNKSLRQELKSLREDLDSVMARIGA